MIMRNLKTFMLLLGACMVGVHSAAFGVELVREGRPMAQIVTPASPVPSVALAARELQNHLERISGARLPIVTDGTGELPVTVYVGESEHTRRLGISLEDVQHDGFKIVARDAFVALVGREFSVAPLLGDYAGLTFHEQRRRWHETTGKQWRFPAVLSGSAGVYEDVYADDGTGTLYAVYELLEQLGMRWYLPMADLGIVYPALETVRIEPQRLKREPQFPIRQFINRTTRFDDWYWYKFMRMGNAKLVPQLHTLGWVMEAGPEILPADIYGRVDGAINHRTPKLTSESLRRETAAFLEAKLEAYPGLQVASIGFPDGWMTIDDDDAEVWLRPHGWGMYSDYAWDFVLDIRRRLKARQPGVKFHAWAYHRYKLPPSDDVDIPDDIYLSFCQNSTLWMLPDIRRDLEVREAWLQRLGDNRMLVYDYYFQHAPPRNFPPIPVIFTRFMEENFRGMYGRTLGFWVDTPWISTDFPEEARQARSFLRRPGLNHLMFYLHNRFAWNADLDLQAELNEYYDLFFGPARAEMREFYEFAEQVWTRPLPRRGGQFLKATDIDRYFDILDRARLRAGDSIYGQRIDLIASEMAGLTDLKGRFTRTGPRVRGYRRWQPPEIDGNLDTPFWHERGATFENQGFHIFHQLVDRFTGEKPPHLQTTVSFRWRSDNSALIVGIECLEPRMDNLKADCIEDDSALIFEDDVVEIHLETPQGLRPVIAVNPAGTVYDACVTPDVAELPTFYSAGPVAVQQADDRWTVEVQVDSGPLGIELPPSGQIPWGVQVVRRRRAGNTPESYMLSPSGGNLDDPAAMANLIVTDN